MWTHSLTLTSYTVYDFMKQYCQLLSYISLKCWTSDSYLLLLKQNKKCNIWWTYTSIKSYGSKIFTWVMVITTMTSDNIIEILGTVIWAFVSGHIVTCYAVSSWCPWKVCTFLKKSRGGVDLRDRGLGEGRLVKLQLGCCKWKHINIYVYIHVYYICIYKLCIICISYMYINTHMYLYFQIEGTFSRIYNKILQIK